MSLPIFLSWSAKKISILKKIGHGIVFGAIVISMISAIVRVLLLDSSDMGGVVNPTNLAFGNNIHGFSCMCSIYFYSGSLI